MEKSNRSYSSQKEKTVGKKIEQSVRSARSSSRSPSVKTQKNRPPENGILLYIVSHGSEGGSFLEHLKMYLDEFKVAQDPREIIANDVFLTLALDKQSFAYARVEKNKTHGIGDKRSLLEQPIIEVLKELLHKDGSTPRQNSDMEKIVTMFNQYHIFTLSDVKRFSQDDIEAMLFVFNSDIEDGEDMQRPRLHHEIDSEDLAKQICDKCKELSDQVDIHSNLYNGVEMIALNQLVSTFCVSKKDLSYKTYNHARKLVKQHIDDFYKDRYGLIKRCQARLKRITQTVHKNKSKQSKRRSIYVEGRDYTEMYRRMLETECYSLVWAGYNPMFELFKNGGKYLDMEITEKSIDRSLQLYPNHNDDKQVPRMYGIYVVKAQHNGKTFCKTDIASKPFSEAIKDIRVFAKKEKYKLNVSTEELEIIAAVFAEQEGIHYLSDFARFLTQTNGYTYYAKGAYSIVSSKVASIVKDKSMASYIPIALLGMYKEYMDTANQYALKYDNPFIAQLVDEIVDPEVRDRLITMFNRRDIQLSEIVAGCKAIGFDKVYAFDPSCREKSIGSTRILRDLGIPYLGRHLQRLGLEKITDFDGMTEDIFREKIRELEAIYAEEGDAINAKKIRTMVVPFLERMLPERVKNSSLKEIRPRAQSLEESPMSYRPVFKQKVVYHPKDNVDFFVFVGEKQLYRRGKIVSGNKAKGYKIKCLNTTCGGLGQSVFEGVPAENISQYDSIHDYVA